MGISAAIIGGVAALGAGGMGMAGSQSAASTASNASKAAAAQDWAMYQQTRSDLRPFRAAAVADLPAYQNFWQGTQGGLNNAYNQLQQNIPQSIPTPTAANLSQFPGYQFELAQGNAATQNQNTAAGLGISGAAAKGLTNYAAGLAGADINNYMNAANTQFQSQMGKYSALSQNYQNLLAGKNAVYNQLSGVESLGENSGAQTGNAGAALAQNAGNALVSGGNSAAQAINSGYNSAGNALSNIGGMAMGAYNQNNLISALNANAGGGASAFNPSDITIPDFNTGASMGAFGKG
jgi:hypothetical protein